MTVDMRLISIKDGGRFAISWLAGTNPRALRSNAHRSHIYGLDVPEVCNDLMKCIKRKNNSISFRILFRLCFGTVKIFSEQVQHLYNVTLNFVCFNTFFLKQYSRKRASSTILESNSKKQRMGSADSVDITNLLMESECFDEYSEENFEFPQESSSKEKKRTTTTSTCIRIKEITIRQISWDCPPQDEEDAFGEATQDERNMLLNEISGREDDVASEQSSIIQKRKSPAESHNPPEKRLCFEHGSNNTLEDIRCAPHSAIDESVSGFNIENESPSVADSQTTIQNNNEKELTIDLTFPCQEMNLDQSWPQREPLPEVTNVSPVQTNEIPKSPTQEANFQCRKRPRSRLITDKYTKLPRIDLDYCKNHIWENCFSRSKKEHVINALCSTPVNTLLRKPTRGPTLLGNFKKQVKTVQTQDVDAENRLLLLQDILGENFEAFKSEFKLATRKSRSDSRISLRCSKFKSKVEEISQLQVNDVNIVNMDHNNNCREHDEYTEEDKALENPPILKCQLDEIDISELKFEFPNDLANQRSHWGKEGILKKLLFLWQTKGLEVNMSALIVGASRINAALAFHTLLDLAGQQYVDILKDDHNSIKSIIMGPEIIRKINSLCR